MKTHRIIFIPLIFIFPFITHANVVITEIMYDVSGTDTSREWIEVQNNGTTPVDFSTYKLFEANTNHKITTIAGSTIPAGGFAVIADVPDKFKVDNPSYTGLLFDSAFSLSNTGETIGIRDTDLVDNDSVSYIPDWGAGGDGNSLQKTDSSTWIANVPTPGGRTTATASLVIPEPDTTASQTNISTSESTSNTGSESSASDDTDISSHSSPEVINTTYALPEFEISSGRPRIGFVGAPISFEAKVKKTKTGLIGSRIKSLWSMGDGTMVVGDVVSHTYQFPGDYIVIANTDSDTGHAVSKVLVKIIEPHLKISLGTHDSIVITNLDRGEINIGGFIIRDTKRRFVVPDDTIIGSLGSITLSPAITKIYPIHESIGISDPSGKTLSSIAVVSVDQIFMVPQAFIDFFKK